MRSKKTALYAIFDSLSQIIRSLLSIYVRRIFIMELGDGLMGLNGFFSSILRFLSLAELGFGSVVAVCLYQSIAEDNKKNIAAYMKMLKKIYWFMGCFILVAGIAIFPIVRLMINGEYQQTTVIVGYLLHLIATAVSYFCSYRTTLLHANQEGYIVSRVNLILYTFSLIAQIAVLIIWKSYFGFLICTILQNLIGGIWLTKYVNKKYNFIVTEEKTSNLETEEKNRFIDKFKAMMVYKISDYLIQGADNMIISVFIGTIFVGYYNNYQLIINMCWAIFASVAVGAVAGIGNMVYTEENKLKDTMFNLLLLQQFIFCISSTGIFQLSTLFVTTFLSKESILSVSFVSLLTLYYYIKGISYPLETVRMGAGIYENDQWKQLQLSGLNVIISISGVSVLGIEGVVLGTLFCYLIRGLYLTPKQIFGKIIEKKYRIKYYRKAALYTSVTVATNIFLYWCLKNILIQNQFYEFVLKGIICIVVAVVVNIIMFCRTSEFEYLINIIKKIMKRNKKCNS